MLLAKPLPGYYLVPKDEPRLTFCSRIRHRNIQPHLRATDLLPRHLSHRGLLHDAVYLDTHPIPDPHHGCDDQDRNRHLCDYSANNDIYHHPRLRHAVHVPDDRDADLHLLHARRFDHHFHRRLSHTNEDSDANNGHPVRALEHRRHYQWRGLAIRGLRRPHLCSLHAQRALGQRRQRVLPDMSRQRGLRRFYGRGWRLRALLHCHCRRGACLQCSYLYVHFE